MLSEIGEIVKFHRKKSQLTQVELAKMAGIGKAAIYDLEHGTKSTRLDTLAKVLQVLNIKVHLESPLMKAYRESQDETSDRSRS